MRLEGNFYSIDNIVQAEDSYTVSVTLNPEHPIYQGHFPGQPVVPGVCTLTVIKECIGCILSKSISFSSIKECKYVSALLPQANLAVTISLEFADSGKVKATVVRNDNLQLVLKLRATIE